MSNKITNYVYIIYGITSIILLWRFPFNPIIHLLVIPSIMYGVALLLIWNKYKKGLAIKDYYKEIFIVLIPIIVLLFFRIISPYISRIPAMFVIKIVTDTVLGAIIIGVLSTIVYKLITKRIENKIRK